VAQKSVNLKHYVVLTGMFRFKPASQFVEPYHNAVSCAVNMENLISNRFCKFSKKIFLTYFSIHFTNQLTFGPHQYQRGSICKVAEGACYSETSVFANKNKQYRNPGDDNLNNHCRERLETYSRELLTNLSSLTLTFSSWDQSWGKHKDLKSCADPRPVLLKLLSNATQFLERQSIATHIPLLDKKSSSKKKNIFIYY
jgi:hypothetical protein